MYGLPGYLFFLVHREVSLAVTFTFSVSFSLFHAIVYIRQCSTLWKCIITSGVLVRLK